MKIRVSSVVFAAMLVAGPTSATIIWDETVNGDLSDNLLSPTSLPALAIGTNEIKGTVSFSTTDTSNGFPLNTDFDIFTFVVPVGQQVDALNISFNVTLGGQATSFKPDFVLAKGTPFVGVGGIVTGTGISSPQSFPSASLPLSSGTYRFTEIHAFLFPGPPASGSETYDITLDLQPVPAVPEPSTLALLGISLAGVALRGRRRYRH